MRDPLEEFKTFNRPFAQRNPDLFRFKVARMAASPFAFFRGSFHLFARDLIDKVYEPIPIVDEGGVEMDLVGDIHSENYGTYKAADGLVHYDVNDFDETTRGHFDFDVRRLTTSLVLAARDCGDRLTDVVAAALRCLSSYTDTVRRLLKKGKALDLNVREDTASGSEAVDALLQSAAASKRPAFIEKLTERVEGQRKLVRSVHYYNLPDDERAQALRLLEDYARRLPEPPAKDFYKVEDVCGRVSGIGSMGRFRYAVLVNGKGSADARNMLLEFKEARPTAYDLYRQRDDGAAAVQARAERVISVQRASQAASSAWLGFAVDGAMSFQVRELGPQDARLDAKTLKPPEKFHEVAAVQAAILGRTHARAVTRAVGLPRLLAQLQDTEGFAQRVLAFALAYADLVQRDWTRFVGQRADLERCEQWANSGSG